MKKIVIGLIVLALLSTGIGYYIVTKNGKNTVNNSVINTTSQNKNLTNNNENPTTKVSNGSTAVTTTSANNTTSNPSATNTKDSSTSNQSNANAVNSNSTANNINNTNSTNNNSSNSSSNNQSKNNETALNISSNFTNSEINTLANLTKAQNISPGAGTSSIVLNPDFYSMVNGVKYYPEFMDLIEGNNWFMGGLPPEATKNGNYSQLIFYGYVNQYGEKITEQQFLQGQLSFNPNNPTNLTNQDIINMVRKIAIIYVQDAGFKSYAQSFTPSDLTNYNGNLTININNTKTIKGQTYYEVEYSPNEPFYISLTGNIFVSQEHYLSKIFPVPSCTNADAKKALIGV